MTDMQYRVTNHEWYSIVRSFIVVGLMFLFVTLFSLATSLLDPMWLNFSIGGTVVKSIGIIISVCASVFLSVKWSVKLFDKKSSMTISDETITIKKGKKETKIYLHDISEVRKRVFASYSDRKDRDSRLFGPLYVEYIVVTGRGVFCESCSVAEGREKMEGKILNKDGFLPKYTIDETYSKLEKIVEEHKKSMEQKVAEAMNE